jgi:hypothetical protein
MTRLALSCSRHIADWDEGGFAVPFLTHTVWYYYMEGQIQAGMAFRITLQYEKAKHSKQAREAEMIYITGDIHGSMDIDKLTADAFPEQKQMSKEDFMIICGDFGLVWESADDEKYWLGWLDDKNFTTLFVDGNHENHHMLNDYPVSELCGGKVHKISESVYHLMRGEVYTICGKKIFAMGGAASHDKEWRTEGVSWWPEEMPSEKEYENAINNLAASDWQVDYIVSHCCSDSVQSKISDYYERNELTKFFEEVVKSRCAFEKWFFGHYHIDGNIDEKYFCMFNKVKKLI